MMAICAVLGAALGLYAKPRWLGVVIAVVLVAVVEGGVLLLVEMISAQPNREQFIARLQALFGEGPAAAAIPVAAALIGGALSAVMGGFSDRQADVVVTADDIRRKVGKNGRFARMDGMVEDREIHARAESRIDAIIGR